MRYIPHTPQDIQIMLKTIGVASVSDLFKSIPKDIRLKEDMAIPAPLHETEIRELLKDLSDRNINLSEGLNFIGAGAYYHYVPSAINGLIHRGEFFTAYTPYQPEVSQGTLQAIYEFQSMMAELTGLEVANASNYDLSTACAEALLMAQRITGKNKALVARSIHPHHRALLQTYFKNESIEIVEVPFDSKGQLDLNFVKDNLDDSCMGLLVQSPNFFGVIEDLKPIGDMLANHPGLFICSNPETISYSVLTSPGEAGADIAIAEGMSLGLGANFGGPYLGVFATKQKYVRNMPGRLVGQTTDLDGDTGYVLTLSTREQHIRREKATSNICTNQSLCALVASIYLSLMGPDGLEQLALLNMQRMQQFEAAMTERKKSAVNFTSAKFNETVIELALPAKDAVIHLLKDRIFSGIDLGTYYPELNRHLLVCTTEMVKSVDIEIFAERLARFL